jgi:1-acyl-sn-glycerol-3-phosphate acyltransferase
MKWIASLGRKVYSTWCVICFLVPFIIFFPFFRLFILRKEWYKYAGLLNRIWSWIQLRLYLIPVQVVRKAKFNSNQTYIYAPNHTSYIDIPLLLSTVPGFLNFVGKASLTRVPLWGKIFQALYISVDRDSQLSRAKTYIFSKQSLDENRSVVIFPEGKIPDENAGSELAPFKDGPFKLAIERKVPLVPVTMPYNHLFLPDVKGKLVINWHRLKIVFHEPIDTTNMTMDDLGALKEKVYHIIKSEFDKPANENRYSNNPEPGAFSAAGI